MARERTAIPMIHFSRYKTIAIMLACLVSLVFTLPNFFAKETVAAWPSWVPKKQVPLGLDLRGGAHLLYRMNAEDIRNDWLKTLRDDARKRLLDAKLGFQSRPAIVGKVVQVRPNKPEDLEASLKALRAMIGQVGGGASLSMFATGGQPDLEVTADSSGLISIAPTAPALQERLSSAMAAAIETVRRRVDPEGTTEPNIVRQGQDRILVQVPGVDDTTTLKKRIGDTALLTFHLLHPTMGAAEARQSRTPPGYRVADSTESGEGAYLLNETAIVRGDDLVDSQPGFDQRTNQPIITFRFNQSGARRFGRVTQENVGQPFAIVLDGKVISAPVIQEPILGGTGQISGNFTIESANNLAIQLRSGALPATLSIVEERTVGPTLGADSIEAGKLAGIVGSIATVILVVATYGTFGVYAVLALAINGIMVLAIMTGMGATLTLPGIAGLILTVGMAVDANVLIYERIKEELRAGKQPVNAIESGFSRAIVTIWDSQLTTLAAAILMFLLGAGPIRGFAVTLTIGIFTSIFTAVFITRLLVARWLHNTRLKTRKIEVPI
jgi:protein-export membrane protein SecD